jgi:hypothetical protein
MRAVIGEPRYATRGLIRKEAPMADREKRELREEKRLVKRAGNKRLRRLARDQLAEYPDEVRASETEPDYGRYSSRAYNGMDRDATRRREQSES